MITAELIIGRIVDWATAEPPIERLLLVGSRTRAEPPDDLADFDVQIYSRLSTACSGRGTSCWRMSRLTAGRTRTLFACGYPTMRACDGSCKSTARSKARTTSLRGISGWRFWFHVQIDAEIVAMLTVVESHRLSSCAVARLSLRQPTGNQ